MTPDGQPALSCRILFVDDDEFYCDLAAETLLAAKIQVVAVSEGDAALKALATGAYDLMVLDLSMPGRSGFDILESARSAPHLADLPIIVITGNDDDLTIERAFESGATSFLAKPLNWPLFVHHVKFVLEAARSGAALRRATRTAEFMSDLKSRLIGTLLTEFQTPLRSAFGFARLINEKADGPLSTQLYSDWAEELHRSLERLSAVHLKMLNFGRALSDQIELNEETIRLAPMLAAIVDHVHTAARRRNIRLVTESGLSANHRIRVDSVLLSNAIREVVENAVKFAPRGSTITLSTNQTAQSEIAISINDATQPLTQQQVEQVLGQRSFSSIKAENVESSTALKMARLLVEAHQGTMSLAPDGLGMATTLLLPRSRNAGVSGQDHRPQPIRVAATPAAAPSASHSPEPALLKPAAVPLHPSTAALAPITPHSPASARDVPADPAPQRPAGEQLASAPPSPPPAPAASNAPPLPTAPPEPRLLRRTDAVLSPVAAAPAAAPVVRPNRLALRLRPAV